MKFLAIGLTVLGTVLFMLSHPNQSILKHHLSVGVRYFSIVSVVFGLLLFLIYLPMLVGVFIWCVAIMLMYSIFPFITVFKVRTTHDNK